MSDDESGLCERLARDLDAHFERVVLTYQDRLYLFALRFIGQPGDAEEVVQDAFVRAYRALASYPPERVRAMALRPWLFRIVVNLARNRVRRMRAWRETSSDEAGTIEPAADERDGPQAMAERAEWARDLSRLLAGLPPRYRAAVILRHVNELDYAEIATLLDRPVGTVKSDVHRGLRLLRLAWEEGETETLEHAGVTQ